MELVVSATTGALNTLLPKLSMLVTDEYKLQKGVKDGIMHLQKDLESMQVALEKVSEVPSEQLEGHVKLWARHVRELSYDIEDTIDSYMVLCGRRRRRRRRHGTSRDHIELQLLEDEDQEEQEQPASVSVGCCCSASIKQLVSRVKGLLPPPPATCRAQRAIAMEIERIKNDVKEASERRESFKLDSSLLATPAQPRDPRLPALYEDVAKFVGIDRSKEELIKLLSLEGDGDDDDPLKQQQKKKKQKLKLVSIVGTGGLGKTTLANLVYQSFRSQFDCVAFVSVSLKPNNKNILCSILRGVSQQRPESAEAWEEKEVIDRIREILKDKRYFIVIDDLWDESAWKHIKCALIENNLSSKIITTTRITGVAELCCSSDQVDGRIYELQPLSLADSEKLFYHKVCRQGILTPDLKDMVQKTLRRCGGLPLAIVTVASLFANNWAQVDDRLYNLCNSIQTGLEDNSDMKDMRGILSLSYCDLPSQLKTCLLYLSIFPEDHIIERDDLIRRWIAEGFVHAKHDVNLFELGESYFRELINRSLIQPMHVITHGRWQDCRVHDMVLEFITSLSFEENFVAIVNSSSSTMKPASIPSNKIRRLSLQGGHMEKHATVVHHGTKEELSHVRSLTVFCKATDLNLPLSNFQLLHVLELKHCCSHNIKGIGSLPHLRYLRLSSTHFIELPAETGNLQFLQTLDLEQALVKELPSTVVKLRQLRCLHVNTQTKLPDGIGSMRSLEELSEIDISKYPSLLTELGNLSKLRVLQMSLRTWDESYEKPLLECLCNLKKLQSLSILTSCVSLDFMSAAGVSFSPPRLLRRFLACVSGYHDENIFEQFEQVISPFSTLPRWINSSLLNLSDLSIMVSKLSQEDVETLRDLPTLYSLDLHMTEATTEKLMIASSTGGPAFRCLVKFKFTSSAMVLVFKRGAMQRLQVLSLSFCLKETKTLLASFDHGFENLTSLKAVDVAINCHSAFLWEVKNAEDAIKNAINLNPNHPTLDMTRHFEREMLWHGNQAIPELETEKQQLAGTGIAKLGPCGGNGGRPHDVKVVPCRLKSVTICSGTVVNSLSFSYCDHNGKHQTAGPWGGHGGSNHHTVLLDSSEFLKEVCGTIGSMPPDVVVTSLTFITNSGCYGPFGGGEGTPFRATTHGNGSIVGFYVRSGHRVDALGVYTNRELEKIKDQGEVIPTQSGLSKIGMWGGSGGWSHDIQVEPHRLESITICAGTGIDSIAFSYIDHNGLHHTAGPWGSFAFSHSDHHGVQHTTGPWGRNSGSGHTIHLGPSEYITEVRGAIGPYATPNSNLITSLKFVTDVASYGPFGLGGGTPFHIPAQSNNSIVGFFGRAGWYVDAIGVYINDQDMERTKHKEKVAEICKSGLWGGNGGFPCDTKVEPHRLENVTICSSAAIDSLAFSFRDQSQHQHTVGPWGGNGGHSHTIQLGPSEFLLKISGTFGQFSSDVITSITLVTNFATYGPFGRGGGTPFRTLAAQRNGHGSSIVGFFARAGQRLDAIGVVYTTNPEQQADNARLQKIGPWGGNGGCRYDITGTPLPYRLDSIAICSDTTVNSLGFSYSDQQGRMHSVGPWGRQSGMNQMIQLDPSEILTEVSGTFGQFSSDVVTSLTLVTNAKSYGPFGEERGTPFQTPAQGNGSIVGFYGRAAWFLDAIGLYVSPEQKQTHDALE